MESSWLCKECGQSFSTPKKYRQYQKYHDKIDTNCNECDKVVEGKVALSNHQWNHKTSICDHCGIVVSSLNKEKHSICDYKTPRKGDFYRHEENPLELENVKEGKRKKSSTLHCTVG